MNHVQSNNIKPIFILTITLMSILGLFSSDIYLPSFYEMQMYFNTTEANIQTTLSAFTRLSCGSGDIWYLK